MPKVAIVVGSKSDLPVVERCTKILEELEIPYDVKVLSAHRTPFETQEFAVNADKYYDIIIAGAGKAAHLPGVIASYTLLPVIGLPIKSSILDGLDSLLSIVQMPKGVPVATVAIDGAENAALLACHILSLKYTYLKKTLADYREKMAEEVLNN
ncbi:MULTISPECIES: 5-(carboxyamino)imidazole ribonucleotide mutase [Thermoanaerobacter]|jgi:5-(carboxyamino)imidazole ribonucleotide mutase|uniref:N5-carboxyaminoimidazole ribonucleotide mutase n=2 Tax=Thermoanaerobacter TaxID=1754 RepID=B0KBQ9_THEP3|nr:MULTISPECIES: 5-(carboxyamino)imidazole ribonucleotide mutase [Thermoanaerobacter]ABY95354.1 phosphoribosylaminoimidazole carboxylase, catalytic subunit [Thermoanaerobacter pseudethanolicus ATCC 33223]ADV80294.1 phosphoribosylaminoimidazole carboxylase, catalytic subunit [Thermoanaerobacter brockii subsp. finnii Ako-1]MBZ4656675.1 phosphoribosylaminoimidazole carboxylase, catalytic subunit [Thermoanaerobacter sp.]MDI3500875.1 5-(carboxyamino)imidazole ribonucleotide mutase [Thermoanaerobacte